MRIFVLTNEDREIIGAAEDMTTAKNLAQEYADGLDCEIGQANFILPNDFDVKGFWRIPCFPNDSDLGFSFDLIVEMVDLYKKGTRFLAQEIESHDDIPDFYDDIPAFLRRQAE